MRQAEQTTKRWTVKDSLFVSQRYMFDGTLVDKCFSVDWSLTRVSKLKNSAEALKVEKVLRRNYAMLKVTTRESADAQCCGLNESLCFCLDVFLRNIISRMCLCTTRVCIRPKYSTWESAPSTSSSKDAGSSTRCVYRPFTSHPHVIMPFSRYHAILFW